MTPSATTPVPPLAGLRVVSLAEQFPGPFASMLLADLGADVILVERPGSGDPARQFPEYFDAVNRNKRSVTLDLKDDDDRRRLGDLLATADVLLDGFRPGVLSRLGFDPAHLRHDLPDLVIVSITGFGQSGPHRDRAAHDLTYQGLAGAVSEGADIDDFPPLADLAAAMFAVVGALTAVIGRDRHGSGAHVDVSMTDALVSWMTHRLVPALNGTPDAVVLDPAYGVFTTSDGVRVTLSCAFEDHFWVAICDALGDPSLAPAATLRHQERLAQRAELRDRIRSIVASHPYRHWAERFGQRDVPFGIVNDLRDVPSDPHVASRGLIVSIPGDPDRRFVRQPLRFDDFGYAPTRPSPALGEHSDEIFKVLSERSE